MTQYRSIYIDDKDIATGVRRSEQISQNGRLHAYIVIREHGFC